MAPSKIDKRDYTPSSRPLLADSSSSASPEPAQTGSSFFDAVAEEIQARDRAVKSRTVWRYGSFAWAIIECLCAGSITAFSLYAPLLQRHLHLSQLQVNAVAIAAELGMYLPVPLSGYLCDRYGPGIPSILAGSLFGLGYLLAAFVYKDGTWPFAVLIVAFVAIGVATSGMYLAAVTTCAKNFGRGRHKGLALALPIAAFGLSGMWQSQIGSRVLYERREDGSRGGVDVFRYFLFLGVLLLVVGLLGSVALRVVDEEEMIDEAVEELERSGLLEDSEFFRHRDPGYGTHGEAETDDAKSLMERERLKKTWLLNEETRRFLTDRTMWLLAAGFFLVTGPGEAFINNLGTIIETLYPAGTLESDIPTSAATHVSIVAIMSTLARIFTGTLTDVLAPSPVTHQHRRGPGSLANSTTSLNAESSHGFSLSRIAFLVAFSLLLSLGQVLLATGLIQSHAERFWLVSASIGAGYGAVFSLTPIIVSVVWGVENFGTNWGIVATVPAAGATVWGLIYSGVYQGAAGGEGDLLCHGVRCYAPTFWAMAVSVWLACAMWMWAWRGPGGWLKRGVAV